MEESELLLIENVMRIAYGGRGDWTKDAPTFGAHSDLHFFDDKLTVTTRPESEKLTPRYMRSLTIPYAEIRKISAKNIEVSMEEWQKKMEAKMHVTIVKKPGEPFVCQVYIEHGKGNHFWNKTDSRLRLRTTQYGVFREFLLGKLSSMTSAPEVSLPYDPPPGDLSDRP